MPSMSTEPPPDEPKPTVNTRTPWFAAMRAASIGSGPVVRRPSVSRMIAADVYDPGGTGLTSFFSCLTGFSGPCARAVARSQVVAEHDLLEVDALVGEQRGEREDDAAADRGMPLELEAIDRRDQVFAVLGRRLHEQRGAGEGHDPGTDVLRQLLHELLRRVLGGDDAVRVDVGRAHRQRDVHRHDDRCANPEGSVTTALGRAIGDQHGRSGPAEKAAAARGGGSAARGRSPP